MTLRVAMIQRHPRDHVHSVERVFDDVRNALPSDIDVVKVVLPYPSTGVLNRIRNIRHARRHEGDINHVTGDDQYVAAFLRRPTVLTVLDLVGLHRLRGWRRIVLLVVWYWFPVRRARGVTTISVTIADELAAALPRSASKTSVVPCPVSPLFEEQVAGTPDDRTPVRVLQVGTGPNKNLEGLIDAVRGLDLELRIIGTPSEGQRELLDSAGVRWSACAGLSETAMVQEYARCDIVAFVSLYEGFGLPIVEGQSMGRPVITADRDPMRWVAGDGALLVDPLDAGAIRQAVTTLCAGPEVRRELVARGRRNIARFDATAVAERYAAVYRRLGTPRTSDLPSTACTTVTAGSQPTLGRTGAQPARCEGSSNGSL